MHEAKELALNIGWLGLIEAARELTSTRYTIKLLTQTVHEATGLARTNGCLLESDWLTVTVRVNFSRLVHRAHRPVSSRW